MMNSLPFVIRKGFFTLEYPGGASSLAKQHSKPWRQVSKKLEKFLGKWNGETETGS